MLLLQNSSCKQLRKSDRTPIRGVGSALVPVNQNVKISLISRCEPFHIDIVADVVPASTLHYSTDTQLWARQVNAIRTFKLADLNFNAVSSIDILLGAECYRRCLCNKSRVIEDVGLTEFGWTVACTSGPFRSPADFTGLTIQDIGIQSTAVLGNRGDSR